MYQYINATPGGQTNAFAVWSISTRRDLTEEMSMVEHESGVESSVEEDNKIDVQEGEGEGELNMECSLLRACDRCTESELSTIPECQMGSGRIITFRCSTTPTGDATENDAAGSSSSSNTLNNDRDTRSYQEYRKDDTYYNRNNNDNLAMIDSFSSSSSSSSSTTSSPPFQHYYESCLHTKDEYEFNYIQFQVFICLLGIVSIYTIRKQKMFAASLFDQRRMTNTSSTTAANTTTAAATIRPVSRNNSRGVVIQRSNTGIMSHNNNSSTNNDGNSGNGTSSNTSNIEMKSLLSSTGSSNSDLDIV